MVLVVESGLVYTAVWVRMTDDLTLQVLTTTLKLLFCAVSSRLVVSRTALTDDYGWNITLVSHLEVALAQISVRPCLVRKK